MPDLPADMLDRAAQAIALYHGDTDCEDRPQVAKYRAQAEAALAAALGDCEAHTEYGIRSVAYRRDIWRGNRDRDAVKAWTDTDLGEQLISRTVIALPATVEDQ